MFVAKYKLNFFTAIILMMFVCNTKAQLILNSTYSPTQLVQNFLLAPGITASNITFKGNSSALGFFKGTATNIGIDSGLILCTGLISNAIGPNNLPNAGNDFMLGGDADLDKLTSNGTFDAAILEFDFVPTANTISFNYVFASEEYLEFVNAGVNDVFGFFISGPLINGAFSNNAQNIAVIPGTSTPITIDNINQNTNSAFYIDNGNGNGNGITPDGPTIQYDGFTKKLTATISVICGETYHAKLGVADAGDGIYDSGIFLEAGSFFSKNSSPDFATPTIFTPNGDGKNDFLILKGLDYCNAKYSLVIYNRWGQEIYSTNNIALNYWDGTLSSGSNAPDGTYYYIVRDEAGNSLKSFLTLIR